MSPKSKIALSALAASAVVGTVFAAPVAEGGRKFITALTGQAEIDAGAVSADMDGSGTAHVFVNHGQRRVCWNLVDLEDLDPLVAAHIHRGDPDEAGGIVISFFHFGEPIDLEDCTTGTTLHPFDRELLKELIQHPERFYVNVHTSVFPGGAIRGQLSK